MIELQFFEPSDFEQLMEWVDSPQFLKQWGGSSFEYPLSADQLERYIEDANHDQSDIYVYKVIDKETGKMIGHISLGKVDRKNKSARIGRVLVGEKGVRGKGIGQLMMKEMLGVAFEELHLHRVSLGVFDFNISAINCYEKAGFTKEGLLRDSEKNGDEYWNMWEMSILENEWLKI